MPLESGILGRDGVKHTGNTMRNIVPHHILDKKRGKVNTNNREKQEEQIITALLEPGSKQQLYFVHDTMQEETCHRSKQTYHKGEDKSHLTVGNMFLLPNNESFYPALFVF